MCYGNPLFRQCADIRILRVFLIGLTAIAVSGARADGPLRLTTANTGNGWVPLGNKNLDGKNGETPLSFSAKFNFHPASFQKSAAKKIIQGFGTANEVIGVDLTGATTSFDYPGKEDHGTTGSVSFLFNMQKAQIKDQKTGQVKAGVKFSSSVKSQINPGKTEPPKDVSIDATADDPISFSDVDPSAFLTAQPDGVQQSLSLDAGTQMSGGDSITITERATLGVVTDPDVFWASTSAVDVYRLTLIADPTSLDVDAVLTFPTTLSGFTLTYFDSSGTILDPTNASQIDAFEDSIASAFTAGVLTSGLDNILNVAIVPSGGSDFTMGQQTLTTLPAVEAVPEPASFAVLGAGLAALRRRRR